MGAGEGKETTEKGKLETWCIVFHSKWNGSTRKQDSKYIRPTRDYMGLLINITLRELDPQKSSTKLTSK